MHIGMPVSHSFVGKTMLNCYWKAYYSNRAKILWVPKLNWFWYSAQYTRYNYIFQNRTHFLLTDINTWLGSLQSDLFIVYRQYDIVFRSHRCRFYNSRQVCRLKKAIATRVVHMNCVIVYICSVTVLYRTCFLLMKAAVHDLLYLYLINLKFKFI